MQKNQIIPQMFDVRPVDNTGDLDWKKINSIGGRQRKLNEEVAQDSTDIFEQVFIPKVQAYVLGKSVDSDELPFVHKGGRDYLAYLEKEKAQKLAVLIEIKQQAEIVWKERSGQLQLQQRLKQELAEKERFAAEIARQAERQKILDAKIKQERLLDEQRWREEYEKQRLAKIERAAAEQKLAQELELKRIAEKQAYAEDLRLKKFKKAQEPIVKKTNSQKNVRKAVLPQKGFSLKNLFVVPKFAMQFEMRSNLASFAIVAIIVLLGIGGVSFASKGLGLKGKVLGASAEGYGNLTSAMNDMAHQNFQGSTEQFSEALNNFSQSSNDLEDMGGVLLNVTKYIPFATKVSSGKNAVEAGKHFSAAGKSLNEVAKVANELKNPLAQNGGNNVSLLDVFQSAKTNIALAKTELDAAQQNIDQINVDDLPKDKQDKFILLKQKLPDLRSALELFLNNSNILFDLLGGNGPRKYLFLFQNNSEMRATGGFIGSYGLLDISNGGIKKFFIDGIFNPDGQLRDKIVPPVPIQKISASWSMHDSNWFPDFPMSAKKAINFYEKTGGPTADGVITFTPALMQKLLKITGPIEMPDYNVTLDADNFVEMTQYKVEEDFDKAENKPKKILSDLAPMVLDKLLSSRDLNTISQTANAILEGLQEKHILLYSENTDLEKMISKQGWSGEILPSSKDYLSVINTNINGFKTDAIVDEDISHKAEIQKDGSIIDTVTISRKHNGGNTQYDWLNKVNADYMRVYVPEGSKLLEVSGQTREVDKPPLDYDALSFKRDSDVEKEEQNIAIDPESGTRIYNENNKTVFANWTYVSPGETMTITYKYQLPFSLFQVSVGDKQQVDSYSLVVQKQSGSMGSSFESTLTYPQAYNLKWNFPQDAKSENNSLFDNAKLTTDHFFGEVFEKDVN